MDFGTTAAESRPCLETVRALHQTVVALRTALEQSRSEILELKQRVWPVKYIEEALRNLSVDNHDLRTCNNEQIKVSKKTADDGNCKKAHKDYSSPKRLINEENDSKNISEILSPIISVNVSPSKSPQDFKHSFDVQSKIRKCNLVEISIAIENLNSNSVCKSLENLNISHKLPGSIKKTFSFSNIVTDTHGGHKMSTESCSLPKRNSDTFSPQHTSSPRHNVLLSSALNVSSSPNISLSDTTSVVAQQSLLSNSKTLENAQSAPVLQNTPGSNDLEQNEEVDDIELIFTTEETKDSDFKGQLVPIEEANHDGNSKNLHCPVSDFDQSLSDRELEDDVFNNETENQPSLPSNAQSKTCKKENSQLYNSKSDNSINHEEERSVKSYYSYQDSSFENKSLEKDESFDQFEEHVHIIETDISKCGIVDVDYTSSSGRRNTCPNPLSYRPIIHREALGKGLNIRKGRPILSHSNNTKKESGAQTDISALPSQSNSSWRSESSLAHRVRIGETFTTLPSKFPLPGSRLHLSEKTNIEARRVLLSDIGFTSMVPELSRSADHLCPTSNTKTPTLISSGQFLRTPDLYSPGFTASQKFMWTAATTTIASPCGTYPLSSSPIPSRRFSAPVSPSRRVTIKPTVSKVQFTNNGSLPELRGGYWGCINADNSGDSTDSLVEEAENYLRRSIDCIVSSGGGGVYKQRDSKSRNFRRSSAPEPSADNVPPQDWQPFLPRTSRDLHLDHWVKVIVPEGKVRGGRVRYVGVLLNQTEQYVGVQLCTPDGYSDGSYNNRRYFTCEPYHGIFVPFKKVVMGWRP